MIQLYHAVNKPSFDDHGLHLEMTVLYLQTLGRGGVEGVGVDKTRLSCLSVALQHLISRR